MTSLAIVNEKGAAAGEVTIDESWLEREKGESAVHDTVVAYLATKRAGTAATKNRKLVRGGGAKPWRQKGTGRARAGSNRSPIWRGGGVIFGPQPRSFAKKVNKKVKKLALRRSFAECIDAEKVIVLDKLEVSDIKTKALAALLKSLGAGENALIITDNVSKELFLSARNLPKVDVVNAENLNVYQLLLHKKVIITSAGLESLGKRLG